MLSLRGSREEGWPWAAEHLEALCSQARVPTGQASPCRRRSQNWAEVNWTNKWKLEIKGLILEHTDHEDECRWSVQAGMEGGRKNTSSGERCVPHTYTLSSVRYLCYTSYIINLGMISLKLL